jgi:hypothetical protein
VVRRRCERGVVSHRPECSTGEPARSRPVLTGRLLRVCGAAGPGSGRRKPALRNRRVGGPVKRAAAVARSITWDLRQARSGCAPSGTMVSRASDTDMRGHEAGVCYPSVAPGLVPGLTYQVPWEGSARGRNDACTSAWLIGPSGPSRCRLDVPPRRPWLHVLRGTATEVHPAVDGVAPGGSAPVGGLPHLSTVALGYQSCRHR